LVASQNMDQSQDPLPANMDFGSVSTFVEKEGGLLRACGVKRSEEVQIESSVGECAPTGGATDAPSPLRVLPHSSLLTKIKHRFEAVKILSSSDSTWRRQSAPRRLWLRTLFGRPPPDFTRSLCASRDITLYFSTPYMRAAGQVGLHYQREYGFMRS
jgi:hypothetical protein